MAKSKLDKLIDQAEETNQVIRDLTFALLRIPIKALPLPPAVRTALPAAETTNQALADAYFGTVRGIAEVIQSPGAEPFVQRAIDAPIVGPAKAVLPKPRTQKQKAFQKKQSLAFAAANKAVRKKNGQLRKGKTQADVAKMAQRILRNGGTKKGQVRKTARRAYEKGRKKVRR